MTIPRSRRFWPWYAAAWLPVLAIYYFAFHLQGRFEFPATALASASNVLPDALLGVGVVLACRRLWERSERRALPAALVTLGIAYAAAGSWSKATLNMAVIRAAGCPVDWASYDRSILLWEAFLGVVAFAVLASVTFSIATSARLRAEEARRAQAELLRARSELKALRAQVEPHFLFNTLHSVRALIGADPAAAEAALEQLGDLLRYALHVQDTAEDGVLLSEELAFVRDYLALEQLRLGERLRVREELSDAALQSVVPAFVLQPLVENAIRHGIGARERGGTIWIRAKLEGDELRLEVRDDGPGATGAAAGGGGRGLELVRQRLAALYGAASALDVSSANGAGFAVRLRLPSTMGADR